MKYRKAGLHEAVCHIYGQKSWHDDAWLAGNREALEAVEHAIHSALHPRNILPGHLAEYTAVEVFCNDGEGYVVRVLLQDDATVQTLAVPYSAEMAAEREGSDKKWPWELEEEAR